MNQHAPFPPYTGQATSRVDGRAKVTGSAKYAGDHNAKGLAYGAVVASTIAARICTVQLMSGPGAA